MLSPEELELFVVGTPELDFEALEKNTQYEGGYSSESAVVLNFWRFVKHASHDTQLKLLKFTTGSPKAPIWGLGEMTFKIQWAGPDSLQLPTSHTCFKINGPTALKQRLLSYLGWKVIHLPFWEWYALANADEEEEYCKAILEAT